MLTTLGSISLGTLFLPRNFHVSFILNLLYSHKLQLTVTDTLMYRNSTSSFAELTSLTGPGFLPIYNLTQNTTYYFRTRILENSNGISYNSPTYSVATLLNFTESTTTTDQSTTGYDDTTTTSGSSTSENGNVTSTSTGGHATTSGTTTGSSLPINGI